jgi:hypothetical protein
MGVRPLFQRRCPVASFPAVLIAYGENRFALPLV